MAFDDPNFYLAALAKLLPYIDGSWVDIGSIVLALVLVTRQWFRRPACERGPFICRDMGVEFVNAASIFPLLLLSLSIVSSKFTEALLNGNKITLSIAGGFALFALLEDRSSPPRQVSQLSSEFVGPPRMPAANSPIAAPKVIPIKPVEQKNTRKRRKRR